MNRIRAIVFDLDDTLYRELDFVEGGFREVSRYLSGISHESAEKIYKMILDIYSVHGRDNTLGRVLHQLSLEKDCEVETLVDIYRRHSPKLVLFDDAKEILVWLKEMNFILGMITDGCDFVQKSKVSALKIEDFFSSIIYTHEFGVQYYKPNPFAYIKMAKNLNCLLDNMVYVGDNPNKDFITAKKLGIQTIRIIRGPFASVAVDKEYDAHVCIDCFSSFKKWMQAKA